MVSRNSDSESLFRISPYYYIHVLDQNSNVTKMVAGPHTFIRQDNERVVLGPEQMITVPPRHYCIIENPAVKDKDNKVVVDGSGQVKLRLADRETRLAQDPFPLYPGEVLKKLEDATTIQIEMFDMDASDAQSAPTVPSSSSESGNQSDISERVAVDAPIVPSSSSLSDESGNQSDISKRVAVDAPIVPSSSSLSDDTNSNQSDLSLSATVVLTGLTDDDYMRLLIDAVSMLESKDSLQVSDIQTAPITQPHVTKEPLFSVSQQNNHHDQKSNIVDVQTMAEAPKQYEGSVPESMDTPNKANNSSLNGLGIKFRSKNDTKPERIAAPTDDIASHKAEAAKLLTEEASKNPNINVGELLNSTNLLSSIAKSIQPVLEKTPEPSIPGLGTSTTSSSSALPFFLKSSNNSSYTNPFANTSANDNSVPAPNTQQFQINSVEWQTKAEAPKQYESSVPKSMEYVDTYVDCDGRSNKASLNDLGIKFRRTQIKTAPQRKKCEPVPKPSDSDDSSDNDDLTKPKVDQKQPSQSSTSSKQKPVPKKRKLQGNKAPAVGRRRKRRRGSGRLSNDDLEPGVEICESADCKRPKKKRNSWVQCDDCDGWYHTVCVGANYNKLKDSNADFFCGCMPK